jgi:LysM repeat protein
MHYPGTGTAVRTASGPPVVAETNLAALTDIMLPFANAAAEQLPGILVGCVTVPMLDRSQTGRPACASPVMVQGILRDKWAYQGVVLADLSQPALADPVALDVFVTNCLAAGCDAVLLGPVTPDQFEQVCSTLTVALRDGVLVTDRMASARARLASWSLALKMETPASEKLPAEPPVPEPITFVEPPASEPVPTPVVEPAPAPITDVAAPAPTPAPEPAATPAAPAAVVEHAIAPGETLDGIAKKYGVSPADIVKKNNLKNTNSIQAGQKLKIEPPAPVEPPKPAAPPETPPTAPEPVAPAVEEAAPAPETPVPAEVPVEAPKAEEKAGTVTPEPVSTPEAPPQEVKPEEVPAATAPEDTTAPVTAAPEPASVAEPEPVPTPEPAPAAEPAPTGSVVEHTIAPGETLEGIAKKYGVSMAEVIKQNDLKNTNVIVAGTKLKIQPPASEATKEAAPPSPAPAPQPEPAAAVVPEIPVEAPKAEDQSAPALPEPAPEATPEETKAEPPAPAALEAKPAPAPESEGDYEYHVVQPGENLYRLSINCGTTKEELMRLNDLKDATLVKVGAKLKVPKKKP